MDDSQPSHLPFQNYAFTLFFRLERVFFVDKVFRCRGVSVGLQDLNLFTSLLELVSTTFH